MDACIEWYKMTSLSNITDLFIGIYLSHYGSCMTVKTYDKGGKSGSTAVYKMTFPVDNNTGMLWKMPRLNKLTKLTTLTIKGSYYSPRPVLYTKALRDCTSIKSLTIKCMSICIDDPKDIALPNLERVVIKDCNIEDHLYEWSSCKILNVFMDHSPNISHIHISTTYGVNYHLAKVTRDRLPNLSYLHINGSELTF